MRKRRATMNCSWQMMVLLLTLHWALLGACYKAVPEAPSWSSTAATSEDGDVEGYGRHSAPEPVIARFLSSVQGDPKLLTLKELRDIRQNTPTVVDEFVKVINSDRLAKDLKLGRVSPAQLYELQNSLIFLISEPCRILKTSQSKKCLAISQAVHFPKEPIFSARLSGFVYPWVNIDNIYLTVYIYNPSEGEYRGDVLQIRSEIEGPLMDADSTIGHQVTWDVTIAILDLQSKQKTHPYPVYMVLTCPNDNCLNPESPWQSLHQEDGFHFNRVLTPNSQTVLEIYTKSMVDLLNQYSGKRSHSTYPLDEPLEAMLKRSPDHTTNCPSFLEEHSQQTKCCLFRFTLSKQQIESNDKLRFIVSPKRLPMNVCHGRCIGVDSPMTNSHSFLMNQYYAGLSDKEQNLIYEAMPCCSASKARNFTIVYMTRNGDLAKETLPNAVKEECSCN